MIKRYFIIGIAWLLLVVTVSIVYSIIRIQSYPIYYFLAAVLVLVTLFTVFILGFLHNYLGYIETSTQEKAAKLERLNMKLQNELAVRKSSERELLIHKEQLVRLAHYDALTSLPNRIFFNEILNRAIHHAKRHNKIIAILLIDFDKFKQINDGFGKHIGNLVLKELCHRFTGILRSGDIIARIGGDELIVLLNDIENAKFAGPVAEKLLNACNTPVKANHHEIHVSASIGVSIFPNDGQSLEDLQKHADLATYKVKRTGGNGYQYYRHEMDVAAHEHIKFETALQHAIQNKEFVLYYQPILNLKSGTIKAVEALIRWDHPEHGLLTPNKFIPFAEETGLIMPIGEWVIREAIRTNHAWQMAGYDPVTIAVNISPKQFYQQDLPHIISQALKESELDPAHFVVEITESTIMEDIELTNSKLKKINAMGVKISIDDFGTGYTSINYLKQFPVSILKIDQSFIKGIPYNQSDTAIASTIISLGHNMGLQVVAEGVETTEQIRYLAEHDCDYIQGYFLSRPLPEGKVILQFSKKLKKKNVLPV